MARTTKAERRLKALQTSNRNLRAGLGKKRKGKHRRRRSGGFSQGGGAVTTRLKAALVPVALALAAVGAVSARAISGYLAEKYPTMNPMLRDGIAVILTPVLAALAGARVGIVAPLASGAVAIALLDKAGAKIAEAIAGQSPGAANAILTGMDGGGYASPMTTPGAATAAVTAAATQAALADGWDASNLAPAAASPANALADSANAVAGIGVIRMRHALPTGPY